MESMKGSFSKINEMENPKLIIHIPEKELTDTASLLDAIKLRIIEFENSSNQRIFMKGPNNGLCIEVVHPILDENKPENSLMVHVSFEGFAI